MTTVSSGTGLEINFINAKMDELNWAHPRRGCWSRGWRWRREDCSAGGWDPCGPPLCWHRDVGRYLNKSLFMLIYRQTLTIFFNFSTTLKDIFDNNPHCFSFCHFLAAIIAFRWWNMKQCGASKELKWPWQAEGCCGLTFCWFPRPESRNKQFGIQRTWLDWTVRRREWWWLCSLSHSTHYPATNNLWWLI